jgi:hypothetical protein
LQQARDLALPADDLPLTPEYRRTIREKLLRDWNPRARAGSSMEKRKVADRLVKTQQGNVRLARTVDTANAPVGMIGTPGET